MTAMVDRVLGRIQLLLDTSLDGLDGRLLIDRLLDVLFGGQLTAAPVVVVLDQLRALAYFNEPTRTRLVAMYRHFEDLAAEALDEIYPDAEPAQRRAVAYALLCLGDANNSFRGAGFPGRYDDAARDAAEVLLSALDSGASPEWHVMTPSSARSRTLNPMVRATSGGGDPDFLRALVEALPAAAFVIDTDGNVRFATRAAAELVDARPMTCRSLGAGVRRRGHGMGLRRRRRHGRRLPERRHGADADHRCGG